ncbi:hypothetical protein [Pedobacter sp. L105]|uniref:hypothetical protein n=1 Tax=Pedobacter sp. L105 TaxID=1641871 RepID=UPI00131B8780|nr:hypothetical protein [Pedobacter sp. L105]
MIREGKTTAEILEFSTEILKWKLPVIMTEDKLMKMKAVAGSIITQSHDMLKEPINSLNKIVIKPRININDLINLNQRVKRH